MPKRASTSATAKASNKKAKTAAAKDPASESSSSTPLNQWRVVLTGDFPDKALLEAMLKQHGATITSAVSGKTTHLILGYSGVNEHGKKTGMGSSKHQAAVEKNLPILSEQQVVGIMQGTLTEEGVMEAKQSAKISATKSSPLPLKVLFCIQETGLEKLSLPRLKKEMGDRFSFDYSNTRNKNTLKKALDTLLQKEKLLKRGALFRLPNVAVPGDASVPTTVAALPVSETAKKSATTSKRDKMCPEKGRWRGLRVVGR